MFFEVTSTGRPLFDLMGVKESEVWSVRCGALGLELNHGRPEAVKGGTL